MKTTPRSTYVWQALELFSEFGDRDAIAGHGQRLTYTELRRGVLNVAATLRERGVTPGSAVLIMIANAVEAPILQLALHLLDCRSMWIAPVTARSEIDEFVKLTNPDAFVYDARGPHADLGRQVSLTLSDMPVFCFGGDGSVPDLTAAISGATAPASLDAAPGGRDTTGRAAPAAAGGAEPESFLQTSGTTGTPKLVHHRQSFYRQILTLAQEFRAAGFPLLRHLSHSPMWLASGQITTLFNLFTGGVLFLRDDWGPAKFLSIVEQEKINSTFCSPPMLYEVLDHPDLKQADCSSLFMFNVGAGPAAPSRLRQAIDRFGPVLRIVYGLSEAVVITALPGLTYDPEHPERLGSCGTPYGDVQIEIRDPDGTVLGPGENGEVWVKTKLSFAGYHGQPELTAETIVDGWVRTRDIGHTDADGYLYLVDRVHDMIVTHRRNWAIFCRPIEDVIASHPQVRAAAVIGVPDDVVGEVPYGYVTLHPGATVTEAELIGWVTETLNEMWAPQQIEFTEQLPLNGSAKVDKQALRAQHAAARHISKVSGTA
ncbi:MAG: class I adenylate-forming enzyme family protein [Micromonosporaceae bacterium]